MLYTKVPARTKVKLKAAATEHMQLLEETPEREKSFQNVRVRMQHESHINEAGINKKIYVFPERYPKC